MEAPWNSAVPAIPAALVSTPAISVPAAPWVTFDPAPVVVRSTVPAAPAEIRPASVTAWASLIRTSPPVATSVPPAWAPAWAIVLTALVSVKPLAEPVSVATFRSGAVCVTAPVASSSSGRFSASNEPVTWIAPAVVVPATRPTRRLETAMPVTDASPPPMPSVMVPAFTARPYSNVVPVIVPPLNASVAAATDTVPLALSVPPFSVIPAALVSVSTRFPALALALPAMLSALVSISVRLAPDRAPRVPMVLAVPFRVIAPVANPDKVPVTSVPAPLMVPALAVSDREPVAGPPVVMVPGMVMSRAVNATLAPETGPVTLNAAVSVSDSAPPAVNAPAVPIAPVRPIDPVADPLSVPVVTGPPPMVPAVATSDTDPVAEPPVVIVPRVRLRAVIATDPADRVPDMDRFAPSIRVKPAPPATVKFPREPMALAPVSVTAPAAEPVSDPDRIAPVSPMVPVAAIRETRPPPAEPPFAMVPGMVIAGAVSATVAPIPPVRVPATVSGTVSLIVTPPPAVTVPRVPIRFAPDRLNAAAVGTRALRVPVVIAPPPLIVPVLAVSVTVPVAEPPVVMRPEMVMPPVPDSVSVSDTDAAETGPVTVSAAPSVRENDPAVTVKAPRAPMALVPVRLTAEAAVPVNVPVVMVPAPLIVPVLANRATDPAAVPPVVIAPGIVSMGAVSDTDDAETGPATVSATLSVREKAPAVAVSAPRVPMAFRPARLIEAAVPVRVPVVIVLPAPLMVPPLASRETKPVTVPPVVIAPGMVMFGAVSDTDVAERGPVTVSPTVSTSANAPETETAPREPMALAPDRVIAVAVPVSVPVVIAAVSLTVPALAISATDPAFVPPVLTAPVMVSTGAVSDTEDAVSGPATVSATPSVSDNAPAAVTEPNVPIACVPLSASAAREPVSVPVVIVPAPVAVPPVENRETEPVALPPVVRAPDRAMSPLTVVRAMAPAAVPLVEIVPGIVRPAAWSVTELPAAGPLTVRGVDRSASDTMPALAANEPREPMALAPVRVIDVAAEPLSAPVVMAPAPLIVPMVVMMMAPPALTVPAMANRETEPVALPPLVMAPGIVMLGAVRETAAAETGPATVRLERSLSVRPAPPVTVKLPRVSIVLAALASVTGPVLTVPVRVLTLRMPPAV